MIAIPTTKKFLQINSLSAALAFTSLALITLILTFLVLPLGNLRIHFFQTGIFTTAFLFGPLAGTLVGGLTSSYVAIAIMHNPWIIGGNALLGFFSARYYLTNHPVKAALLAYAIQLPYLIFTDIFLAHMPVYTVSGIVLLLFFENLLCGLIATTLTPQIKTLLNPPQD
jgi:uncharacterized membrane protein